MESQQHESGLHQRIPGPLDGQARQRMLILMLMRIAGTLLALVGSCVMTWLIPHLNDSTGIVMAFLVPGIAVCLLTFIGALLFRSWWAVFIVTLAGIAGMTVGVYILTLPTGFDVRAWGYVTIIGVCPIILSTICGSGVSLAIGHWWEDRRQLNWALKEMAQRE
jgi:hypothetical protein